MSTDNVGDSPEVIDTAAREAANTEHYEACRAEMQRLLDADPIEGDVSPNEFVAVGEDLGNALSSLRQRYRSQRREEHKEAREKAEEQAEAGDDAEPLAGTLAAARDTLSGLMSDGEHSDPAVVESGGRPIAVGENPLTPAERVRVTALDSGAHQDVYVLNEESEGAQRGPRADRSDSPLVKKYHSRTGCPNADYGRRDYSLAGLHDAKWSEAVPCPSCVIERTDVSSMADALTAAPALADLPKNQRDWIALRTSGFDTDEKHRHESIVGYLTRNDAATVADIADSYGLDSEDVEADLETMGSAGAVTYEQGDSGDVEWRLVGTGASRE